MMVCENALTVIVIKKKNKRNVFMDLTYPGFYGTKMDERRKAKKKQLLKCRISVMS